MVRAKPLKIDCMGLNPSSTILFRDPGHLFFFFFSCALVSHLQKKKKTRAFPNLQRCHVPTAG